MVSVIETGRGRRMAYLHRDRVNGRLRGRRGARLASLTSGGAIPETGDYRVLMEPGDVFVGTVNEDFAIESFQGVCSSSVPIRGRAGDKRRHSA